jgi:hypothetical protein
MVASGDARLKRMRSTIRFDKQKGAASSLRLVCNTLKGGWDVCDHWGLTPNSQKPTAVFYHTRHAFCGTIFAPALHPNALPNCSMLLIGVFTRYFASECGFVRICVRATSGL